MPNFTNVPPPDPRGCALDLVRTPTKKALLAAVTSDDIIGTPTHFYGGRTVPCENPDCEPCRRGIPWRWHGYLGAWESATHKLFLFEFTARIAEIFVAYREAYGTLRGCVFHAKRVNSSPNAKVHLSTKHGDWTDKILPPAPNVIEALAIIWNIATPDLDIAGALKQVPRINVNRNGTGAVMAPPASPPVD